MRKPSIEIFIGIFFTSLSIIMFEILLTRIFSVMLLYHLAFMVISLALFGFAAAGVYLFVFCKNSQSKVENRLAKFSVLFAIFILISLLVVTNVIFNPKEIFSLQNFLYFSLVYVTLAIPFFFGGLCLSLSVSFFSQKINKIYFFDLLGAGIGCLLVIYILEVFGGESGVIVVSLFSSIASLFFIIGTKNKKLLLIPILLIIVFFCLTAYNMNSNLIKITFTKGKLLNSTFVKWNSYSRIDATPNETATFWAVSENFNGTKPNEIGIRIDASAYTGILNFQKEKDVEFLKYDMTHLAFYLKEKPDVLIIGPGGGRDVVGALLFGSKNVTGIELNPIIVDLVKDIHKDYSGNIYNRPEVNIVVDDARSYLTRTHDKYDIIQASLVDTWASVTSGSYTLSEDYLYTKEAFIVYINRLKDDGLLSITRWEFEPPHQAIRLVSIALSASKELGIQNPEKNIISIGYANKTNFIFKKSEFTTEEIKLIEDKSRELGFKILYTPKSHEDDIYSSLILSSGSREFYENYYERYKLDITPTIDDKPFFFYTIKLPDIFFILNLPVTSQLTNIGVLIIVAILVVSLLLISLFIIIPLYFFKRKELSHEGRKYNLLLYFLFLGLGFMMIEMSLIQKFILFLGHPVYSLSVILFSLLFFSGIGSYLTGRFDEKRLNKKLEKIVLLLCVLLISYIFILPTIFTDLISLALIPRIFITVILILPLGLLMGMPFPIGIKIANKIANKTIPWVWGINGSASVLGSILAVIVAMNFGFNLVLVMSLILYFIAMLLMKTIKQI